MGDENFAIADVIFLKPRILGNAMDIRLETRHTKPSMCDTINLIYQAALQPLLWSEVLNDIRMLCNTDQCTLFFYDAFDPSRCLVSAARADEQALASYLKNFIKLQAAQINNQLKALPEGTVATNEHIRQFSGDEYSKIVGANYMENIWPNLKFEAGVVLLRGDASCAGLRLQNFNNSQALSAKSVSLLQKLSPHLRQAMQIHQKFTELENTNDALKKVLHSSKVGVILLDGNFTVQLINHKAKHALEKIDNQVITQKLTLEKIDSTQLHKIINHLNSPTTKSTKSCREKNAEFQIFYKNGHLKVNGYLLEKPSGSITGETFSQIDPAYLILIRDSNESCDLGLQYLQSAYEITATERKLILGLINGDSLLDNANSQMVKPSTVRWHLKNIMQKTLTHSQTELTRLMLELRD